MILARIAKFLFLKIKFAKKCKFDYSCDVSFRSKFEGMNKLCSNVSFSGYLGYGSYVGPNCKLRAKIGRFCSIASNVNCNPGSHPYKAPYVSISPCFYSLRKQNGHTFAQKQLFDEFNSVDKDCGFDIVIENDVWVCDGVFINGGIHISTGAVIFSHAVVTKDVPPYAIVGGVPAKIIGYRYDENTIDFLLKSKWWAHEEDWFREHWLLMSNIDLFKEKYDKVK